MDNNKEMDRKNQAVSFNLVVRSSFKLTYNEFIEYLKQYKEDLYDKEVINKLWDKLMEKFQKEGFDCDIKEYGEWDQFENWINDEIDDCE